MRKTVREKGSHTWDIYLHYHGCPKCGKIIESREKSQYRLGRYQKELECPRCHHHFTLTKQTRPTFGPIFGESNG